MRTIGILLLLLCMAGGASAQYAVISSITTEGNKRTKERTILRELSFAVGDSIPDEQLQEILKKSENQIYITQPFDAFFQAEPDAHREQCNAQQYNEHNDTQTHTQTNTHPYY